MSRVLSGLGVDVQWVTAADALLTDVREIAANIFYFDPNLNESAEVSTSNGNMSIHLVETRKLAGQPDIRVFIARTSNARRFSVKSVKFAIDQKYRYLLRLD